MHVDQQQVHLEAARRAEPALDRLAAPVVVLPGQVAGRQRRARSDRGRATAQGLEIGCPDPPGQLGAGADGCRPGRPVVRLGASAPRWQRPGRRLLRSGWLLASCPQLPLAGRHRIGGLPMPDPVPDLPALEKRPPVESNGGAANNHAGVGDPSRPARRPARCHAPGDDRRPRARPRRGAGEGDGRRRQLQRRLGCRGPAGVDLPLHRLRLSHRRLRCLGRRRGGRPRASPAGSRATRWSSTATRAAASAPSATGSTRWPARSRRSGPTRPTGAASPSSARCRRSSSCPSPRR